MDICVHFVCTLSVQKPCLSGSGVRKKASYLWNWCAKPKVSINPYKSALQRVQGESFRCPTPSPKMAPWSSCPAAISLRSPPHPPRWLTTCDMGMFNIQVSYSILHRYMTIVSWRARVALQQTVLDNSLQMGEGSRKDLWVTEWIHWICF